MTRISYRRKAVYHAAVKQHIIHGKNLDKSPISIIKKGTAATCYGSAFLMFLRFRTLKMVIWAAKVMIHEMG